MFRTSRKRSIPEPRSSGTLKTARVRQPWPPDRDFHILSIDGGGIRGILPLAFLAKLEQSYLGGASIAGQFDLVAGTSTGGIIALGLGKGKTASEILNIYLERGGEVFPDYCSLTKHVLAKTHFLFNRCNHKRLNRLIGDILEDDQLWQSAVRLCIPSAETKHFEPAIFKTPHHPDYRRDWKLKMSLIAQATSAAPTFFRPVATREGYEFVDGGIWANNPMMVAIADALSCFDIKPSQIRVLSLGCVRDEFKMSWARRYLGGMFFWRTIIMDSMHIESQNVIGQARLIVGHHHITRVDADPISPRLELWDWARCKDTLPTIADELFAAMGSQIANAFLASPTLLYQPIYTPSSPPAA